MKNPSPSEFASPAGAATRRIRQRKQPVQRRAQATVRAIREAALQVLLRRGYAALTTTRVAERAGVSVGTLYQYYPDKRSLVAALQVEYVERIVERIADAARASIGLQLEAAARAVVSAMLAVKRNNLALSIALRDPVLEAGGREVLRDAGGRLVGELHRVLAASAAGLRDPQSAARLLVSAIEGVVSTALYEDPTRLERPELEQGLVALVVGYVREQVRWEGGGPRV